MYTYPSVIDGYFNEADMRSRALRSLLICLAMIFSCGLFAAEKLHVTFINPGKSDEAYWMMVTAFMKAENPLPEGAVIS